MFAGAVQCGNRAARCNGPRCHLSAPVTGAVPMVDRSYAPCTPRARLGQGYPLPPEPVGGAEINLGVTPDTVFLPQDCICHPAGASHERDAGAKAGSLAGPRLAPRKRRRSCAADRRGAASGGECRDESPQPHTPPLVSHRHRECRPTPGSIRGFSWWGVPSGPIQPEDQPDVTRPGDGGRVECGGTSLSSSTPS
jgi:hypothetical protein